MLQGGFKGDSIFAQFPVTEVRAERLSTPAEIMRFYCYQQVKVSLGDSQQKLQWKDKMTAREDQEVTVPQAQREPLLSALCTDHACKARLDMPEEMYRPASCQKCNINLL